MVFETFSDFTKLSAQGAHFLDGKNGTQGMMGHAQGHRDMPKVMSWVWDGVVQDYRERPDCVLIYGPDILD